MSERIRVLIPEDTPSDVELVVGALRQAAFEPEWEPVEFEADFATRVMVSRP